MTPKRIRGVSPGTQEAAQKLRHQATPAEQTLWASVRGKQIEGVRFRRQHPMGQFVVDFCVPSCRLVVELDGEIHHQKRDQDMTRAQHIEAFGFQVLRFRNEEVLNNLPRVLEIIRRVVRERLKTEGPSPPLPPSPNSGRGGNRKGGEG